MTLSWRAGAAEVVVTPPVGVELEGYGNRASGSVGVHDELYAHALVLDDGRRRAAIVTVDVIWVDAPIVARVRAAAAELDIPPERVLIACTHTHCGPRGLLARRGADAPLVELLTRQIVGALRAASGRLEPARLMAGEGRIDSVSMNRRRPDGPIDTAVRVLRVEGEDGELRAALVNYGCHPTVLNYDTLEIGRDWPGHVDRAVKALWGAGAAVLFANGACADINPVKISQDHRETRRVGTIVGAEAARVLGELAAHGKEQVVHNLLWSERPLKPPSNGAPVSPGLAGAIVPVSLPWKSWPSEAEYESRLAGLRARIEATPPGQARRDLIAERNALSAESPSAQSARPLAAESPDGFRTEVQALRLGDELALVTAPGELMYAIGAEIQARSPVPRTWVLGYANDAAGYLVTDQAHAEGGYEAGRSMFTAGVEARLVEAAQQAIRQAKEEEGEVVPAQST
ncbi:MAG TPA: neutral/alkaline non-lysosomal ceramidase N-terminal domain-containing protein [Chloroflexota bacterium]|jgi:hypothetical protein